MFTKVIMFAVAYEFAGIIVLIISSAVLLCKSVSRFGSDAVTLERMRNAVNGCVPKEIKAVMNGIAYCIAWPILSRVRGKRLWEVIENEFETYEE